MNLGFMTLTKTPYFFGETFKNERNTDQKIC
jgi:hypothetical protein